MSTKTVIGKEPGYGMVFKCVSNFPEDGDFDDFFAIPDTDYDRFRFNSKLADLTPMFGVITIPAGTKPNFQLYSHPGFTDRGNFRTFTDGLYPSNTIYRVFNNTHQIFATDTGFGNPDFRPVFDIFFTDSDGWSYPDYAISPNEFGSRFRASTDHNTSPDNSTGRVRSQLGDYKSFIVEDRLGVDDDSINVVMLDLPFSTVGEPFDLPWASPRPIQNGQSAIRYEGGQFKVARPGYDTRVAAPDELIIGGDFEYTPVYMTQRVTVRGGSVTRFRLPTGTPNNAVCLIQWNAATESNRIVPAIYARGGSDLRDFLWRIEGDELVLRCQLPSNEDFEVLLIVIGREPHPTQAGQQSGLFTSFDNGDEFVQVFNSNGSLAFDSRYSFLPIIQRGVIDISGHERLTDDSLDNVESISFVEQGYIPYVLALYQIREIRTSPGFVNPFNGRFVPPNTTTRDNVYTANFFSQSSDTVFTSGIFSATTDADRRDARSFWMDISNNSVDFYFRPHGSYFDPDNGFSNAQNDGSHALSITYYVFGVPDVS